MKHKRLPALGMTAIAVAALFGGCGGPTATASKRTNASTSGTVPTLAPIPPVTYSLHADIQLSGAGVTAGQYAEIDGVWVPIVRGPSGSLEASLPAAVHAGAGEISLGSLQSGSTTPRPFSSQQRPLVIRPVLSSVELLDGNRIKATIAPQPAVGQLTALTVTRVSPPPAGASTTSSPGVLVAGSTLFTLPQTLAVGHYVATVFVDGIASLPVVVSTGQK